MNGHVYQTFNESDNKRQFGQTTEALGRWINMHTKNSGDLMVLHTNLKEPTSLLSDRCLLAPQMRTNPSSKCCGRRPWKILSHKGEALWKIYAPSTPSSGDSVVPQ
jgi:hypothetical protein